ncbi:NAD(P)H-dependent oxidoreductase [Clostridium folliculivorans]|uniref:Flavodoxin n=1 Tax=Clostridium folliculivorans TaxID=2886038 RepID=A0A9W6DCI8_9CLOT|nr:NAD(P)H-dependent oxidoreductase [Clostridium folliculivorans]GKU27047.1 flavodoxin [Clostridium folliculivorans]GKU29111.1 flavodoxin [Clostridium folliculivorans]
MEILMVSDSSNQTSLGNALEEALLKALKENNYDYKHYNVSEAEMKKCIGCFNCWVKTPGLCIFDDITRDIAKEDVNSDLYIILNEVKYGGYSPKMKKILDRSICKILPFFKEVNGEMHHAPRYDRYPDLLFVGYGEDITPKEEQDFKSLNQANAINFQAEKAETQICRQQEEIEASVLMVLNNIKKIGGEV